MLLALAACAALQAPALPKASPATVEFKVSPVVELWFDTRVQAEALGETPPGKKPEGVPHVLAMHRLVEAVGNPVTMGLVEGALYDWADVGELRQAVARLPKTHKTRQWRRVPLRELALDVVRELRAIEDEWLETEWPARREALRDWRVKLRERFDADRTSALYTRLNTLLGFNIDAGTSAVRVPLYLVSQMPWPGAVTHRRPGGGVSFIGVGNVEPLELLEVIVHESLHTLDVSSPASLFSQLRRALRAAGADPKEANAWAHSIFFLEAAETVREDFGFEAHVDYGESHGVYGRTEQQVEVLRPLWTSYRRSEIDRRAFVEGVAKGVLRERD